MNKQKYSNSATVAIQKRLNAVFQNCQFVLVWASSKPVDRALTHLLAKKVTALGLDVNTSQLVKNNALKAITVNTANKNLIADQVKLPRIPNISKVSFPKEALNKHCLNINLPIVGCGVDLLVLQKFAAKQTLPQLYMECKAAELSQASAKAPSKIDASSLGKLRQNIILPLTLNKTCSYFYDSKSMGPENSLNRDKQLKTYQAAILIDPILETQNFASKWQSNQLLGAFIKEDSGSVVYVSGAELKQTNLLQQAFKGMPPKQIAKQPFVKVLTKIKETYSGQSKVISKLVKNLVYIINCSRTKIIYNISSDIIKKSSD